MKCHFYRDETLPLNKQRVTSLQMRSYFSKDKKLSFNNKETHFQYVKCYLSTGGELPLNKQEVIFQQQRRYISKDEKHTFKSRKDIFRWAEGRCSICEILSGKGLFDRFVHLFSICRLLISSTYPF